MILKEADEILLQACKAARSDYTLLQRHTALQVLLSEFIRLSHCTTTTSNLTLAANAYEVDFSTITTFRPERTVRLELAYNDEGVWDALHGTYNVNDFVKGDGTPDAFFYACVLQHTAAADKEPPNDTYWKRVSWDSIGTLLQVSYPAVADYHNRRNLAIDDVYRPYVEPWYWDQLRAGVVLTGRPVFIGFRSPTLGVLWPTPSEAYVLRETHWEPLVAFTPGLVASEAVVLNIPEEYIRPAIFMAGPAFLQYNDPKDRRESEAFVQFQQLAREVKGTANVDTSVISRRRPGIWC
jgi:hypothetical protein